jgi:hypothetical protein
MLTSEANGLYLDTEAIEVPRAHVPAGRVEDNLVRLLSATFWRFWTSLSI